MKKKIVLLLLTVIAGRMALLLFVKTDVLFFLSPRNFNGRGLLAAPVFLDFLIPLTVVIFLFDKSIFHKFEWKNFIKTAILLLVTALPAFTGFILSKYSEETFLFAGTDKTLLLRWVLFVLTFWSINLFASALKTGNLFLKRITLFAFVFFMAVLQDGIGGSGTVYIIFGAINSVGLTTAMLAVASRKFYKKYPLETLVMAAVAGIFTLFIIYNAQSQSYFTIFLPMLAMYLVAWALYCSCKKRTKTVLISLPVVAALFLNYVFPVLLPAGKAIEFTEKNVSEEMFTEQIGNITVKYPDKKLRDITIKLAKVIEAANKISKEEFGISPEVNKLTVLGIAPGGFHGKYPGEIVGNLISEKYLENCNDSVFLNNPDLPAGFPDPVNGILHEYSHLYGSVPYRKWLPGAEEEGWATFSATKLSALLHKKYGDTLWKPAYDYARQAKKIKELNLSGKAVVWSHPNEFGGFILWNALNNDLGTKKLYLKRWKNTYRDLKVSVMLESNPKKARKLVEAFGKEKFFKYGSFKKVVFGNIYSLDDYLTLSKLAGVAENRVRKIYSVMKNKIIDPSVPIPDF